MIKLRNLIALLAILLSCCKKEQPRVLAPLDSSAVVIGEIVERSTVPDPAKSDYPDCLFSVSLRVAGHGASVNVPEKIMVLLPAFKARKLDAAANLKPHDLVKLRVLSDKDAPKALKEMQRADTLSDFSLPLYYATSVEQGMPQDLAATTKPTAAPASSSDKVKTVHTVNRYPWSPKAAAVRRLVIEEDIARIRNGLTRHGGSFESWQKDLAPMIEDLARQVKKTPHKTLMQDPFCYEHLREPDYRRVCVLADKNEGPFKMLVSMNRQFRARGIDLIIIPYPHKEEVNADIFTKLAPDDEIYEPARLRFILKLLEADVETLDMIPALRAARAKMPNLFYSAHDAHPADGGLRATAGAIAARIERYDLKMQPGFVEKKFSSKMVEYFTNLHEKDQPERRYEATQITWADGSPIRDDGDDTHTPLLMLGDSFTVVPKPYGARDASVSFQLAPYLGNLPDFFASMGNAPTFLKVLARESTAIYEGRCVAVFMFSPHALLNDSDTEETRWIDVDLPDAPAP